MSRSPGPGCNTSKILGNTLDEQGKVDEAIAAYEKAIHYWPDLAGARYNLGNGLRKKGKLDAALAAYDEAIRIKPDFAEAHINRGYVLRNLGRRDEAAAAYRQAICIDPGRASAPVGLGSTLDALGMRNEAVLEYREAIRLHPSFVEAHTKLAGLLANMGEFQGALEEIKWFAQAFGKDPSLAEDVQAGHCYNAACAAMLTAGGIGKQPKNIEAAEWARLRHQALAWLQADLAAWEKMSASAESEQLPQIVRALVNWQKDSDLASLRDEKQLEQFSLENQELSCNLWAAHTELVKWLRVKLSPMTHSPQGS